MKVLISVLLGLAVGLAFTQAQAATKSFDITAEISVNGKVVSKPRINALPNQSASITSKDEKGQETTVELTATDFDNAKIKNGIKMKMSVTYIDGESKTVISRPEIVAKSGEPAEISVGENGKSEALKIKIIATRIN